MRILHVIDSLGVGGAERVLVDLCNILHSRGIKVSVLVLTRREELKEFLNPEIPYYNLDRKFKYSIKKVFDISKICRNFDLVHVHMRHVLKYVLFCDLILRLPLKIVFHDHFGDINHNRKVDKFIFFRRRRITYVGVSRELKLWARESLKMDQNDCYVVPNIIKKVARREEDSNEPTDRVILVSNFRPTKNIEFAIEFFASVKDDLSIGLDVFGRIADRSYFLSIVQLIKDLRLENAIRIFTDSNCVQKELYKYSFALHTSKSETGPLVLIEYFAHQIPFLAFRTGQVAEQASSVLPRFFINNFDITCWKERFHELRNTPVQQLKETMLTVYESEFSEDSYYLRWKEIYVRTLSY